MQALNYRSSCLVRFLCSCGSVPFLISFCIVVWTVYALFGTSSFPFVYPATPSSLGHNIGFRNSGASQAWEERDSFCDYASGVWIRDEKRKVWYDESCPDIFKGWNCGRNKKPNSGGHIAWRWQPWQCDLPRLDPLLFLWRFRDKNIGFVGDSLNRNMYISLVCTLRTASKNVKKWRPFGADKGVTFLTYNLTVVYHRTNLLARYGRWEVKESGGELEKLGYKKGFQVDVDVPQSTWAKAPQSHHVLIVNTGHWWFAPEKFLDAPLLFFEKGEPIIPPKTPEEGLGLVLHHMLSYIEKNIQSGSMKFLRLQSPRHFEGGDWHNGGTCQRTEPLLPAQVHSFFALESHGVNSEARRINAHLIAAINRTSSTP